MIVGKFEASMAAAKSEPKGVKVCLDLWLALKENGLITMKRVGVNGIIDLGFEMPYYKNTVLIIDPELEIQKDPFILPPSVHRTETVKQR